MSKNKAKTSFDNVVNPAESAGLTGVMGHPGNPGGRSSYEFHDDPGSVGPQGEPGIGIYNPPFPYQDDINKNFHPEIIPKSVTKGRHIPEKFIEGEEMPVVLPTEVQNDKLNIVFNKSGIHYAQRNIVAAKK